MYSLLLFVVYNAPFFSVIALLGTKMFCFYIIKYGGKSAKTFLFILFFPQILVSLHQKIIYDFIRVYK